MALAAPRRAERWAVPEAHLPLLRAQTPETLGERCLGDPSGVTEAGEEAGSRAVRRSVDG